MRRRDTGFEQQWNPMEDAYNDKKFNAYKDGPGADLDPSFQAKGQATTKNSKADMMHKQKNIPFLFIYKIPNNMNVHMIKTMCSRYGKIQDVRFNKNNHTCFVDCHTIADMEAIKRALSNNEYGFQVAIGKHKNQNGEKNQENIPFEERPAAGQDKTGPRNENRSIFVGNKNPKRTYIKPDKFPTDKDYELDDSLLKKYDPDRQYKNLSGDAHALERNGTYKPKVFVDPNSNQSYKNGRAYKKVPESVEKMFESFSPKKSEVITKVQFDFVGKCILCNTNCFLTCARCNTFYCGAFCQAKDWSKHRLTCGKELPMQEKEEKKEEVKEISNENLECNDDKVYTKGCPLSDTMVTLTAIIKSNVVFLRSFDSEENLRYIDILTKVAGCGKSLKSFDQEPKIGSMVLTRFENQINRALVLGKTTDGKFRLSYIDYGGVDEKSLKELYEVNSQIRSFSILTKPVVLKNVPDCFLSNELRSFMYSYLDSVPMRIKYSPNDFIAEKGVFKVELIDEVNNCVFNDALIKLCKPIEPSDEDVIMETDLEKVDLPFGEDIELIVMDNSMLNVGLVACTTKGCAEEIQKFQRDLDDYVKSLGNKTPYAPRLGELCIAQYSVDKQWYRGVCCELVGDGFPTILFLDYGNIGVVDIKYIRKYPKQLALPVFTRECLIKGLPLDCDENLVKRAEELLPCCCPIKCDKVEMTTQHVLTINDFIQTLIDEKLLVSFAIDDDKENS